VKLEEERQTSDLYKEKWKRSQQEFDNILRETSSVCNAPEKENVEKPIGVRKVQTSSSSKKKTNSNAKVEALLQRLQLRIEKS
jgi:hypothetical protein